MAQSVDAVPAATAAAASGKVQSGSGRPHSPRLPPGDANIAAAQAAVEYIRKTLASSGRRLEFRADPATAVVTVVIRDALTDEEIRSVPGSALVGFAELLSARNEAPQGLIDLTA
jgi:FlaG protein